MLTHFGVRNFKSFREATLTFSPLTVIIGANASGKSNLLEALQLLSSLASGRRFDQVLAGVRDRELALRGPPASLVRFGEKDFALSLEFNEEDDQGAPPVWEYRFEASLIAGPSGLRLAAESMNLIGHYEFPEGRLHREAPWPRPLYRTAGRSRSRQGDLELKVYPLALPPNPDAKPVRGRVLDQQLALSQQMPFQKLDEDREARDTFAAGAVDLARLELEHTVFLDPVPRLMRGYAFRVDTTLKSDGANLSSVLFDLCANRKQKDEVLRFIGSFPEQDVIDLDFIETPRAEVMIQLAETFGKSERLVDAALLSDGTLRALAVAAALLSTREGSTLVIEELDNGVHPTRASMLLENIERVAKARHLNVVLTTHNPALLDALPDAAIPAVQVCYRDPRAGDSRLVTLGEFDRYPELLAQGRVGELVSRGVLDRFLKLPSMSKAKRRSAADWFEKLRKGANS